MKIPKKSDALVGEDKETEEEGVLNPEDLSLIDENTWEPSDEEILAYALKLGYDIEKDPDELFEVAYYYMKYPLPEGWKRAIYKKTKELMYINMEDGEIEVCTEIEELAHQMYLEKKEEMLGKLELLEKEEKEETKNDPSSIKMPPLNPIKKSSSPGKIANPLPPVKDKNGSKNNLFNNEEDDKLKETNDKKIEKKKMKKNIEGELNFDRLDGENNKNKNDDKKMKNNDDIIKIIEKPSISNNIKEKDKDKDKDKLEKKDKNIGIDKYPIHTEESQEENEYEDDFNYDGLEDDSEENKEEPLIKSMINKEKKEKEEKQQKNEQEKEKKDKEKIDYLEKLAKEKKEKEKKEKEKEKEKKEREEKIRKEKEKEKEKQKEIEKQKTLNDKLIKEKKEYLNKKIKELQEYKEQKKSKYEKAKKDKEQKNKNLKDEYNSKLKKEINNKKLKIQSQLKEKLQFYETTLINKKLKEEKKYKEEFQNLYEEKKKEKIKNKEKEEEEIKLKLKERKTKILKKINQEKNDKETNELNYKEKKLKLQKNIKLLEEKKKIDINNINKRHELSIKDYEINIEQKFIKEKEHIRESLTTNSSSNNNYNSSSSNLNFSMSGINDEINESLKSKIIDNIQKALENEYEINCKEIEQELINNKIKEIEKYHISLEQEKKEKILFYKNEILSNEKEYYKTLSNIRQISQKKKMEGDNYLNMGFEQTLTQHEETKNKIGQDNKKLMSLVVEGIQKLIIQNNSTEQTEIQIEEFLIGLKDTYHLMFQKSKNTYEMIEYDYKYKKLFIKYLLEVINYLSKIFSSSTNDIYDIDKKFISENLLKFCKDKINNFKNKFQIKKKKRIYKFLKDNLLNKNQSYTSLEEFSDTKETNTIFVNSFKRKFEHEKNNNIQNELINNESIMNKIDINESINNINKNSFNFKSNTLLENINKINNNFHTLYSSNGYNKFKNNNTLLRTRSLNDYNINDHFLKLLNLDQDIYKLEYFIIDQNMNCSVPIIPEEILENIDEETLMAYSAIILFLKNEYLKLIEINQENKENINNLNKNSNKKNINLNLLILDKIKIYAEDAFIYIINNYQIRDQKRNIKQKIQIVQNYIEEFKNNFNVDKYLKNPNIYSISSVELMKKSLENDLVDDMIKVNGNEYNFNNNENKDFHKSGIDGINSLILNGKFNGLLKK